ncbi:MAG: DEAD/DEAH box helicase [Bacteroidetes bacterium]|nr:DEAD/DEAH box helicase [Bacteroidota bacterium]
MENQETQKQENAENPENETGNKQLDLAPAVSPETTNPIPAPVAEAVSLTEAPVSPESTNETPAANSTEEPVEEAPAPVTFDSFGLDQEIMDGIRDAGYITATSIQAQGIPAILGGKDVIGSAQTGTGKTAAFVVPILQKLMKDRKPGIRALILSPTRELATQISDQIWGLGYYTGISSCSIIGGTDWADQADALKKGANIVVATPGRLLDQMRDIAIDFSHVEIFVLDEADRMLDMGFIPAVMNIIARMPPNRQNLMFSATIPAKIKYITQKIMVDPVWINVDTRKAADTVTQTYYVVPEYQKTALLEMLIKTLDWKSVIVFTGTKKGADLLAGKLSRRNIPVTYIHGDRTQEERDAALNAFKSGQYRVLIATDVLARGIDISDVSHIVNFDVPRDTDDYIHRIGRTGRAESEGSAISLVSPSETRYLDQIVERMGLKLNQVEIPEDIQIFLDTKIRKPDHQRERRPHHRPDHRQPRADTDLGEVVSAAEIQSAPGGEAETGSTPFQPRQPRQPQPQRQQGDGQRQPNPNQNPNRQPRQPQGEPGQPRQQGEPRPQQNRGEQPQRGDQQNRPANPNQQRQSQGQRQQGEGQPRNDQRDRQEGGPRQHQGPKNENRPSQAQGGRSDRRPGGNQNRGNRQFEKPASRPARKEEIKLSQPVGFIGFIKKLFGK